jgi:UDP-N-acetyl-D-galactosamine dehydrogenase
MDHQRKISVVGLGYVGLPVAVAFGKQRRVIGFDTNPGRIEELGSGYDRTHEVAASELVQADVLYTSDPKDLGAADFYIVTVPTPIDASKQPDLRPLFGASDLIGRHLKPGDIVVFV